MLSYSLHVLPLFLFYQGYSQSKKAMTALNSILTAVKDFKGFLSTMISRKKRGRNIELYSIQGKNNLKDV